MSRAEPATAPNPVQSAELLHLRRLGLGRRARWFTTLFTFTFGASLFFTLCLYLLSRSGSLTSVNIRETYSFVRTVLGALNFTLGVMIFFVHVWLVSQVLFIASNSVVREKTLRTWDTLVLTGITAEQVVTGKFWATLHYVYETNTRLIFLRVAAMLWLGLAAGMLSIGGTPDAFAVILAPLVIALYTALSVLLTAALGVLGSLTSSSASLAFRVAIFLNLGAISLPILLALSTTAFVPNHFYSSLILAALAPLDGGLFMAYQPLSATTTNLGWSVVLLVISAAGYVLLALAVLSLAVRLAQRQNALPSRR